MATFKVTGGVLEVESVVPSEPDKPWGGADEPFPTPPIVVIPPGTIGGKPEHPIWIPVYPAHPIVIPPDVIGPGVPAHPIVLPPPRPEHPIVIPPGVIDPGPPLVPAHPIVLPPVIWDPVFPTPPIEIPPEPTQPPPEGWQWVYSVLHGWVLMPPGGGGKPQPVPPA